MNSDTIKGDWKQLRGQIKEAFGKLTDDDLLVAEGNVEQLTGAIQKRYGYTREQADQEWTAFTERTATASTNTADAARGAVKDTFDALRGAATVGLAAASGAAASAARAIDPATTRDARPEPRDS